MFSSIAEKLRSLVGVSPVSPQPSSPHSLRKRKFQSDEEEPSAKRVRFSADNPFPAQSQTPFARWLAKGRKAVNESSMMQKIKSRVMSFFKDEKTESIPKKQAPPFYTQSNIGAFGYGNVYNVDQSARPMPTPQSHGMLGVPMVTRYPSHMADPQFSFMAPQSSMLSGAAGDMGRAGMPRVTPLSWNKNPRPGKVIPRYDYKNPAYLQPVGQPTYRPVHDRLFSTQNQRSSPSSPGKSVRSGVSEAYRLHERQKYADLLQSMTSVPLKTATSPSTSSRRPPTESSMMRETLLGTKVENLTAAATSMSIPSVICIDSDSSQSTQNEDSVIVKPVLSMAKSSSWECQRPASSKSKLEDLTPQIMRPSRSEIRPTVIPPPNFECETPRIRMSSATLGAKSPSMKAFEKTMQDSKYMNEDWLNSLIEDHNTQLAKREHKIKQEAIKLEFFKERRDDWEKELEIRIKQRLRLSSKEPGILEETFDEEEEEKEEEDEFPPLGDDAESLVDDALHGYPPNEALVECFRLTITRSDMATLSGLNWLNDEVINFYMELIRARAEEQDLPKVHAFNTFFYPKISQSGQQSVRRWTKKVNIFEKDYLLIPVHLGMHWCLCVVDFRKKAVKYYDSMLGRGDNVLRAVKQYLIDEKMDKQKEKLDMSDWSLVSVKDIPQQMNGSDCGVFTCKYADYISKDKKITFNQSNMPYFRRRMVYEIMSKKLMS